MLRLDNTTRKLQIVLAGLVTTNQLPVLVAYSDKTATAYSGATQLSNTNSTTAVDICAAPAASTVRDVDYLSVRNSDTAAAVVTIRYNDNATLYTITNLTLSVGDQLIYVHGDGWRVIDSTGQTKTTALSGLIAANVTNTPAGSIAATNVQTALNELDTEKLALAGGLLTGAVGMIAGTAASPGLYLSGDTNTGLYSNAADHIDFATAGVHRVSINPTGCLALGGFGNNVASVYSQRQIQGDTQAYGFVHDGSIDSVVTGSASIFFSNATTEAAAFTLGTLFHFRVQQPALGAGSAINIQVGYYAGTTMTGAVTNYGFYGEIAASGTARWNFYAGGTAPNYFAGVCQFADGSVTLPSITNIGDTNTGIYFSAADTVDVAAGGVNALKLTATTAALPGGLTLVGTLGSAAVPLTKVHVDYTNTATIGAVTINKASGRVNIAAAGTSVVVTNSLVTAASHVMAWASTNDATARVTAVVPAAGSFTIYTPATTAQTSFDFVVFNAD